MDYFARLPFFQAMRDVQSEGVTVDQALQEAAQAQAEELTYLYNVGYVLLFPPIEERPPYSLNWEASWRFAKEIMPLEEIPFWRGDGIEAYRVIQPTGSDDFRLDFGAPGTLAYRGEGWDNADEDTPYGETAIWATDDASRLFVPLRNVDPAGTYQVSARMRPFGYPGASELQTVALTVNGITLASQTLTDLNEWQTVTWTMDGALLVDSLNRFSLHWGWQAVPRVVIPGDRAIGTTGRQLPIDVDIKGFAEGGFIALFDEEGEQSNGSAGRNGVNVTVLDPATGEVTQMAGFDTTANPYESEALAAFVNEIPADTPVLVVSQGAAWAHLTAEAIDALRGLGMDLSLEGMEGNYLAAVGLSGAVPGTAAVNQNANEAFLRISLVHDRRSLAAAVDWLEISR